MRQAFLFFICVLLFVPEVTALPRFALRGGSSQCIDCHVNPTGGAMRNRGGWSFGKTVLPMYPTDREFKMSNSIGENIQFGLDFRGQYLGVFTDSTAKTDFQKMTGSIYTNVDFAENISAFARYDFIWGIWEAYAIARILPNGGYLKGGTFQPNYGIRLDDHTAYTRGGDLGILFSTGQRQGLIYEPRYVETGIEAGAYISDFALLTASVGNPRSQQFVTEPTYTVNLQITRSIGENFSFMFGSSAAIFRMQRLNANFQQEFPQVKMYGGYAGFSIGEFVLLGEYDISQDYLKKDSSASAMMIEASYKIVDGLEAVVRYDRFDRNTKVEKDELQRFVIGFEFVPYSFVEVRPQFRIQLEEPAVQNNSFVVQFHLYY